MLEEEAASRDSGIRVIAATRSPSVLPPTTAARVAPQPPRTRRPVSDAPDGILASISSVTVTVEPTKPHQVRDDFLGDATRVAAYLASLPALLSRGTVSAGREVCSRHGRVACIQGTWLQASSASAPRAAPCIRRFRDQHVVGRATTIASRNTTRARTPSGRDAGRLLISCDGRDETPPMFEDGELRRFSATEINARSLRPAHITQVTMKANMVSDSSPAALSGRLLRRPVHGVGHYSRRPLHQLGASAGLEAFQMFSGRLLARVG